MDEGALQYIIYTVTLYTLYMIMEILRTLQPNISYNINSREMFIVHQKPSVDQLLEDTFIMCRFNYLL